MQKVKSWIIKPLNDIVKWDRYGIRGGEDGYIFGWIERDDGFYDFAVINFKLIGDSFALSYNTSSKKYSIEIGRRLKCTDETYVECKSARDIIPEGASLVRWQQEPSVVGGIGKKERDR